MCNIYESFHKGNRMRFENLKDTKCRAKERLQLRNALEYLEKAVYAIKNAIRENNKVVLDKKKLALFYAITNQCIIRALTYVQRSEIFGSSLRFLHAAEDYLKAESSIVRKVKTDKKISWPDNKQLLDTIIAMRLIIHDWLYVIRQSKPRRGHKYD